jgi:hypothetical protein
MTDPTEASVRRIVGRLLRSDYRGEFFCSSCKTRSGELGHDLPEVRDRAGDRHGVPVSRRPQVRADVPLRRLQENDAVPRGAESVTPPHPSAE